MSPGVQARPSPTLFFSALVLFPGVVSWPGQLLVKAQLSQWRRKHFYPHDTGKVGLSHARALCLSLSQSLWPKGGCALIGRAGVTSPVLGRGGSAPPNSRRWVGKGLGPPLEAGMAARVALQWEKATEGSNVAKFEGSI